MKIFIVVKDETDYNGDRSYPRAFTNQDDAEGFAASEREAAERSNDAWNESTDSSVHWVPNFYVEESEMD